MSEPRINGEAPPEVASELPPAPQQSLDIDDVNGRLAELSELNSALMGRCATLRGQVSKLSKELAQLKSAGMH